MKCKLFSNISRMTTGFCIGILCVTLTVLGLRLTVFSDMAATPENSTSNLLSSEADGYQMNSKVYFSNAGAKGDVFITNLSAENLIKVDFVLADDPDTIILSTGLIKPGVLISSTKMNANGKKLEDGSYECIAQISAYDPEVLTKPLINAEQDIEVFIGNKPSES